MSELSIPGKAWHLCVALGCLLGSGAVVDYVRRGDNLTERAIAVQTAEAITTAQAERLASPKAAMFTQDELRSLRFKNELGRDSVAALQQALKLADADTRSKQLKDVIALLIGVLVGVVGFVAWARRDGFMFPKMENKVEGGSAPNSLLSGVAYQITFAEPPTGSVVLPPDTHP